MPSLGTLLEHQLCFAVLLNYCPMPFATVLQQGFLLEYLSDGCINAFGSPYIEWSFGDQAEINSGIWLESL